MTVRLAVAGAFHTEYMSPAVEKLKEALASTTLVAPRIPVVSNVDAQPHSDPAVIKDILSRQVGTQDEAWCTGRAEAVRYKGKQRGFGGSKACVAAGGGF